jgi:hypothetical protein
MSFELKYLKYKNKYLKQKSLKNANLNNNLVGGGVGDGSSPPPVDDDYEWRYASSGQWNGAAAAAVPAAAAIPAAVAAAVPPRAFLPVGAAFRNDPPETDNYDWRYTSTMAVPAAAAPRAVPAAPARAFVPIGSALSNAAPGSVLARAASFGRVNSPPRVRAQSPTRGRYPSPPPAAVPMGANAAAVGPYPSAVGPYPSAVGPYPSAVGPYPTSMRPAFPYTSLPPPPGYDPRNPRGLPAAPICEVAPQITPSLTGYDFNSMVDFIRYINVRPDLRNFELTAHYWANLITRFLNSERAVLKAYNQLAPRNFPRDQDLMNIIETVNLHAKKNEKEFQFVRMLFMTIFYK